jgi:hypothetical protein
VKTVVINGKNYQPGVLYTIKNNRVVKFEE